MELMVKIRKANAEAAAAEGKVGAVRRDPMAMLPFIGYNVGDYFQHWVDMGAKGGDKMPKVFLVNWFRKGADGRFLWPGFGENSRVLKWIVDALEGRAEGNDTAIGKVPTAAQMDIEGLDVTAADVDEALAVNEDEWKDEVPGIAEWLQFLGDRVPDEVHGQFGALKGRLGV